MQRTNGHAAGYAEARAPKKAPELVFARDISFDPRCIDPIKHTIGRGEVGFLFGPSTAGKTFVAFDLEMAVATARSFWCGRRVKPGAVLHVAFEGAKGARKRLLAATRTRGDPGDMLAIMETCEPLNRHQGQAGIASIIASAMALSEQAGDFVALIVIDTLSAAAVGEDEDTAADMAAFVDRLKQIAMATGAAVLCIHHTGKDTSKGMRGSAALKGNADFVIELTESRELRIEKCREGKKGTLAAFELEEVTLGTDDDGDVVTSCVVRFKDALPQGDGKSGKKAKPLPVYADRALDQLERLYDEGCAHDVAPSELGPGMGELPAHKRPRAVRQSLWRERCVTARLVPGGKKASERQTYIRAGNKLEGVGQIARHGEWVWLLNQQRREAA